MTGGVPALRRRLTRDGGEYGRPGRRHAAGIVVVAALPFVLAPLTGNDYVFDLGTQAAIYALAIMGLSILYGWCGQISLAHAVFFGMGAYATAYVRPTTEAFGLGGLALELGAAVAVGVVAGLIVGLPALRVSGLQLAIVTMGFALVYQWALIALHPVTGGTQGRFIGWFELGSFSTTDPRSRFLAALVFAAIGGLVMLRLHRTPLGRSMAGIRDTELAAQSVGVVPSRVKLWAFVISAVYASVAGWLFAYYIFQVTPGNFQLFDNIYFLAAVIIGGRGLVLGCWLGAAYLVVVPDLVRNVGEGNLYPIVSGVVLVLVVLMAPSGVADVITRAGRRIGDRIRARKSVPVLRPALSSGPGAEAGSRHEGGGTEA